MKLKRIRWPIMGLCKIKGGHRLIPEGQHNIRHVSTGLNFQALPPLTLTKVLYYFG